MTPELIQHQRLMSQGSVIRAALYESYGWEITMTSHDIESLAVSLTGTRSLHAIDRLMHKLLGWWRTFATPDTSPCLQRGDAVLWQLTSWHNPRILHTKSVTVVCQVGEVVYVRVRDRDGYVVRKLERDALKVRGQ